MLQLHLPDTDGEGGGHIVPVGVECEGTVGGERRVVLSDLVACRLVPVKVVLAIEARAERGRARESESSSQRRQEHAGIEGRLDTGESSVDG